MSTIEPTEECGTSSPDLESAAGETEVRYGRNIRYITSGLIVLAAVYAFLVGFHTVYDLDLGWQLATGRWVVQHHQIPSTDVFSYTARGNAWIYPVFSGVAMYLLYQIGGYAALSWLTAIAMAISAFLLTRQRNLTTAVLTIFAVPVLSHRIVPRADLFSTLLFAAFLAILWQFYRRGSAALWMLPLLSVAWVNFHLGFVLGILLCCAYVAIEILEIPFADRRAAALERLKRAWPWLAAACAAIVINPWGPKILVALIRQNEAMKTHSQWIGEWVGVRPSWTLFMQAFSLRQPDGGFWLLMSAAFVAVVVAIFQRRIGAALLVLAATVLTIQHIRFQAVFASVVVIVGGSLLSDGVAELRRLRNWPQTSSTVFASAALVAVFFVGLVGVRSYDLVSNDLYLRASSNTLFGTGLSWWFPERAFAFVEREHLPGNLYHDYNSGGFVTWRLPQYPDYIDGRAIPFGTGLFRRAAYELPQQGPESPLWQQEAETRGINTIVVSIAFGGELFPNLRGFCSGQSWRPVYLDEVSAVFVRSTPATEELIRRLQIDCSTVKFTPPARSWSSTRTKGEEFNFWVNSAVLLGDLDRSGEAMQALEKAQEIFPDNNIVHYLRGMAYMRANNFKEAEVELRRATELNNEESSWSALAQLMLAQGRYKEASEAIRKAADVSAHPQQIYMELARLYLQIRQPRQALEAFDLASETDIFAVDSGSVGDEFHAQVAEGRAISWWALGNKAKAVQMQEQATKATPQNADRWRRLAALYQAVGRYSDAQQALERAR